LLAPLLDGAAAHALRRSLVNIEGLDGIVNHTHARKATTVMADMKARFEQAVAESKQLPDKPDNMTLLKIYALYKQASAGDVDGKRPGFSDLVGRAKWDAWNEQKGKPAEQAMKEYVDLIESLK
jgi:acyl-CoA-binding protein